MNHDMLRLRPPSRPAPRSSSSTTCPDWLFPRVSAVVHHGGSGTTAGRPSLLCPMIGDQQYWAEPVHALGAGPDPSPGAS